MEINYILAIGILLLTWILFRFIQRREHFKAFERLSIPGPKPSFFWGNFPEINAKGLRVCTTDWYRRYGDVFGVFFGAKPFLCIADPELLKNLQVKDFNNFTDKDMFIEGFGMDDDRTRLSLGNLSGIAWKNMRSKLSPTFTMAKVRQMAPFVTSSVKDLLRRLESQEGRIVDLGAMTDAAVMEVSISGFTGVWEPVQEHPDSGIAKAINSALDSRFSDLHILYSMSFPSLAPLIFQLMYWWPRIVHKENSSKVMLDAGDRVYRQRLLMQEVPNQDVLQLLIDYNKEASKSSDGSKLVLTDDEIVANTFTFVVAGYDTSSLTMKFTMHLLAHHQDVQDRLREEVREVQGDKEFFNPEDAGKLPYMDQVVSEVLRLYPPAPTAVQRLANKDYEINGKIIPSSIPFLVPVSALHKLEKYWSNPGDFDPERFSPERKGDFPTLAYQPFGAGPRMCIGARMANMLVKAMLAQLLHKYRLLPSPGSDKELPLKETVFLLKPRIPVKVLLERVV